MAEIFQFGRVVREGDVLRLGGAGFYRITCVEKRKLHGIKVLHPTFPAMGEEICLCNDYLKDQYMSKGDKFIHIPITHADGIPVR